MSHKMFEDILLFDGAMGTYFAAMHEDPLYKCEYANLTHPHTIRKIHNRYLKAGVNAIKTNTFSLMETTIFSKKEIITAAYQIAVECAEQYNAYVFCDLSGILQNQEINILEVYCEIIDYFVALGGTYFLLETLSEETYLEAVVSYIREAVTDAVVITSFAINPDGFTKLGLYGQDLIQSASRYADAVGFNCGSGPYHMTQHMKQIQEIQKPIIIMPNASYPTVIGNRVHYETNPIYFAKKMEEIVQCGATIIGGCCGTTPTFLAETKKVLRKIMRSNTIYVEDIEKITNQSITTSRFYEKLKSGYKPIAVELDPPIKADVKDFLLGAKELQSAGVDIITIADCPVARARMDSSLLACKLKRELGVDTIPHLTCRDRNINASKALLLGLNMEAIQDVLVVTGDPIPTEERGEVKAVYEFNSRMMIQHIRKLNETLFDSPFYLYAALNLNARNFSVQLKLAQKKVENGAVAFFTQPVLSASALENLKLAKETLGVPIIGGIMPIVSHRNAMFINNEIPGITICDDICNQYIDKTKDECTQLSVHISSVIAKEITPYIDGYYIITPFKRVDIVTAIIQNIL